MSYDESTALRALLDSTPDLMDFLDAEGRYQYAGTRAAGVLGQTPEGMTGRRAHEAGIAGGAT